MSTKKVVFGQVLILGVFLAVPLSGVFAADDGQRMNFGRGEGRGQTPPPAPTVASCVEKTGKTEAECQAMITNWGNRKPGGEKEGRTMSNIGEKRSQGIKGDDTKRPVRAQEKATDRFVGIEARLSRVVAYLKSKGVSTTVLESDLVLLKEKIASANTAGESFEAARTTWKNNKTDANKTALESTRTAYKESIASVKVYYQGTVLPLVKTLLQSITE